MTQGPGGRIPPDNRGPQAKGVGKNAKRHDLERRSTPYLHDSDLQQGDVEAMKEGQRVAPVQTQQPAAAAPASGAGGGGATTSTTGTGATVPDPIDFFAGRANGSVGVPTDRPAGTAAKAATWLPILRMLAAGPGSSGLLGSALINQARQLNRLPRRDATVIDMQDVDAGLAAMLDAGL